MGSDLSETRMSEYRVLKLLDDMNNWAVTDGYDLKYVDAITETYWQALGDDVYGSGPLTYIKLDALPPDNDWSSIFDAMMEGDFYNSTGEVRFHDYGLEGNGANAVYRADVEWTFPLDFVEVVWGDGTETHVVEVSAAEWGAAFGRRDVEVPVDLSTAKWARFAAWDVAGNGAFTMPVPVGN
jgi:hypothetical protein